MLLTQEPFECNGIALTSSIMSMINSIHANSRLLHTADDILCL